MTTARSLELYEPLATLKAPLHLERCCWAVYGDDPVPRQCSGRIREWIKGRGYCLRHAKMVKPTEPICR